MIATNPVPARGADGPARVGDVRFVKGHGTENDFVIVPDPDAALELSARTVAAICDRRAGIGGDGLLRVVPTAACPEVADQAGAARWFMDYRNADGSVAEMCGNGVRVFARYLIEAGLVDVNSMTTSGSIRTSGSIHTSGDVATLAVATRGGVKLVRLEADGQITVDMGIPELPDLLRDLTVHVGTRSWSAVGVRLPNPHAVAFVDTSADAGPLTVAPCVEPAAAFPSGVNVEFVVPLAPDHVAFRVHERGVGETRSCGTGAAAVAVAARRRAGRGVDDESGRRVVVDVPGGRLAATERADGHVDLMGPAVLLAEGVLRGDWLAAVEA